MTKIILTHDVDHLGVAGDVVEVKDGYARNYLIPRRLAAKWTKGAASQISQMRAARRKREIATIEDARIVRDALQAAESVLIKANSGESGRLFGAVSTQDIAAAVQEQLGQTIDRRKIVVTNPIKAVGEHQVQVNLHPEISANLAIAVVAK